MCDDPNLIPDELKEMTSVAKRTHALELEMVTWNTKLTRLKKLEHTASRRAAEAARREGAMRTMRRRRAELRADIQAVREVRGEELARCSRSAQGSREWRRQGPLAARAAVAAQRQQRARAIREAEAGMRADIAAQPKPAHEMSHTARFGRGLVEATALRERRRANKAAALQARLTRESELRERLAAEKAEKAERAAAHRQRRLDKPLRARELRRGVLDRTLAVRRGKDLDKCSVQYYKIVKPTEHRLAEMQREEAALRGRLAAAEAAARAATERVAALGASCPARELRSTTVPRGLMATQPGSPTRGTAPAVLSELDAMHQDGGEGGAQ